MDLAQASSETAGRTIYGGWRWLVLDRDHGSIDQAWQLGDCTARCTLSHLLKSCCSVFVISCEGLLVLLLASLAAGPRKFA